MGTQATYLPPSLSTETIRTLITSLDLPTPTSIKPLQVRAAFHTIYLITFPPSSNITARSNPNGTITLVLRVSGRQLPDIKTRNEVGVMTWVRRNTTIPVPAVLRFDNSEENPIGHEFTLLEMAPGVSVDQIYDKLSDEEKTSLVRQLTDYLIQLHAKPWDEGYVGGLKLSEGKVTRGPPIDENFWQMPDLQKYWFESELPTKETLETLNPISPDGFSRYVDYTIGCLERYIHAIEVHPSLETYRDMIPRIRAFITQLQKEENTSDLNHVTYVLAHKDLHFANIMCAPSQPGCPITAVLDWEFSGVVPAPRWNPPRAFLWNMKWAPEDKAEQSRMEGLFEKICLEKGAGHLLEEMTLNDKQEQMQTAVNHIRAIVEVCPRGQAGDKVGKWREVAERAMDAFT
ncbi:phosphotransferase family protein [Aspergillus mulundensis]|uniref:Protein kinase-like n=1 Tax=Aspergillus mulundensis TaxID=1810919 RepID=A0A3D8R477_9EURO|nr:Protein kinase-like [Aspergillus mulundensis]RDW68770.1 Protein kinase-like [Aspergillus mulundensis]